MRTTNRARGWWLGVVALALGACDGDAVVGPRGPGKLDLLLVIDDSGSMDAKQRVLGRDFGTLLDRLDHLPAGRPDLHVGVVSSSVGAGPHVCPDGNDRGVLQVRPGCGLDAANDARYLARDSQGGANFSGDLAASVACLVELGNFGCGYEHHLQSLRLALDEVATPENRGFRRADAQLGILILGDEDDCSAEASSTLFDTVIAGQSSSVRCALRGHACDGRPIPAQPFESPLDRCMPSVRQAADDGLIDVADFVAAVRAKTTGDPVVAVIAGWSDSPQARYALRLENSPGGLELASAPICMDSGVGDALPALRLVGFARAFAQHSVAPVCTSDLAPALARVGDLIAAALAR